MRILLASLAEAPARSVSLCHGCARLSGRNADGTAACEAFASIPAAIWAGAMDHRAPLAGDAGATFVALGDYGRTIEHTFDNQLTAAAVRDVTTREGEVVEVIQTLPDNRPSTPDKQAEQVVNAAQPETFHTVMVIEGAPSGDRRLVERGATTWRDLPLPFKNGRDHGDADHVAMLTRVERQGDQVHGWGYYLDTPEGQAFQRQLESATRLGVSFEMDDADIEIDWPDDYETDLFVEPDLVRFTHCRLMSACALPTQAFAECFVEPLVEAGAAEALIAAAIPTSPPAAWFQAPDIDRVTPLTISDTGRVFGHLAAWGTCHTSFQGTCVTPPHEDEMSYFATGSVITAEGEEVAVGQITMGTGHAPGNLASAPAAEHYDHTGTALIDVACGPDEYGIWVAGALRPGVTPEQVRVLRASAISGDWRKIGGRLRLVAALSVNVPGFPIPRTRTLVSSGEQVTLLAAGMVMPHAERRPDLDAVAEQIASDIGRDRLALVASLVADVHPQVTVVNAGCNCGGRRKAPASTSAGRKVSQTASAGPVAYEVVAPDGSRTRAATLIEAMRSAKAVRGRYRVVTA